MFIGEPLTFAREFIEAVDEAIRKHQPGNSLSNIQKYWLSLCIMAVLLTNSVCWARFERASIGKYKRAALSWMFKRSKVIWESLLHMSVKVVLQRYEITEGCLVIDDTNKKRSKSTKKIANVHRLKDRNSGGSIMGQSIVFLILVTPKITIPVGFKFYMPAPELTAWYKTNRQLKENGVPCRQRPPKPPKNQDYPNKRALALALLQEFKCYHPAVEIKAVIADALYGTEDFLDPASAIFNGVQTISQIRSNQKVRYCKKEQSVSEYFQKHPGVRQTVVIRGGEQVTAFVHSARLHVCSHNKKRLIVALKYEDEEEYRYLVASNLSWRTMDVVQAFTLRWLIEVFFQDWKSYEGWDNLTKLPGQEGSSQGLILSLLVDHCLLLHPEQLARLENKLPAATVGSLRDHIRVESLLSFIRDLLSGDNPEEQLNLFAAFLKDHVFQLNPSKKHLVNRNLGRLEPTPSLKYKAMAA